MGGPKRPAPLHVVRPAAFLGAVFLHPLSFALLLSLPGPAPAAAAPLPYRLTADRLEVRKSAGRDTTFVEGHVVFLSGQTLLRAQRGAYVGSDREGRFEGAVEIFHEGTLLLGPSAALGRDAERLEFPSGVLVIDGKRTILADRGEFDLNRSTADFTGAVEVIDGGRTMASDSLHVRSQDEGEARGRVVLTDRAERVRASGESALLSTGRVRLTEAPTLLRFDARGEVESKVSADTLDLNDSGGADARGRVRIERGATAAEAAAARIDSAGTRADLTGSPRAFREGRELTGDSLVLSIDGSEVREVVAAGAARLTRDERIAEEGKPLERALDAVSGDSIRLEIDADSLRRAVVWGKMSSHTERQTLEGALLERNDVTGDTLILFTSAGEADRVRILGNAKGVYLPRPEERPTHADSTKASRAEKAKAARADTAAAVGLAEAAGAAADTAAAAADTSVSAAADSARAGPGAAVRADSASIVHYSGQAIDFLPKERRIVLSRSATVEYQDMTLDANEINYDLKRMALIASGSPVLHQGKDEVEGKQMGYNLDEAKGIVYKGRTHYQTGYLEGGEVVRMDASTLDVRNGSYTSCDLQPPHYHFASRVMRVYLDDKTVARPVVLYIRDIPVFALPFYMMPLEHGRHSGFLLPAIEFGINDRSGRFVRNLGYYWATNDYMDFALTGDFYQNQRWQANLQTEYAVRYLLTGNLFASYSRSTVSAGGSRQWDVRASHNQQLGNRATLTANADFLSDINYRLDNGRAVDDLTRDLKSDATFSKSWASQSLSLTASRRQAIDRGDVTERLPSLRYSVSRLPILGAGAGAGSWYGTAYLSSGANLVNARDKTVIHRTSLPDSVVRTDHFATEETFSLSDQMKLFGWLGLSPSVDYREALFDKDARGDRWQRRGVWSAGSSANTTMYGTWKTHLGPLVGVRHIMAPSVSFRYAPDFNEYFDNGNLVDRFPSVSGIGGTPRGGQSLGLSMSHTVQVKLKSGEKERSIDNLLTVNQSISRNLKGGARAWSSLSTSARLQPIALWELSLSASHSVYEHVIESLSIQNSASIDGSMFGRKSAAAAPSDSATQASGDKTGAPAGSYDDAGSAAAGASARGAGQPWRLTISHSYSKGRPGSKAEQGLRLSLTTNLTQNWHLDYNPYLDLRQRDVISQDFTLVRDLHCWEARFSGRYFGQNWEYYFRIQIKAHPDVGYERGRKALNY